MDISSEESVATSSSSRWKYHVFLSFYGEDTGKKFPDHIGFEFYRRHIHMFKDDEKLEGGKPILPKLLKVIEESRFAVIILSKNYAASTQCLDELAKIVECMKERGLIVMPVFYNVDSSDVRNQTGTFAKAFVAHEEHFKENMEKVQIWKAALSEVANLAGWQASEYGTQSELLREIAEKIFRKLCGQDLS